MFLVNFTEVYAKSLLMFLVRLAEVYVRSLMWWWFRGGDWLTYARQSALAKNI